MNISKNIEKLFSEHLVPAVFLSILAVFGLAYVAYSTSTTISTNIATTGTLDVSSTSTLATTTFSGNVGIGTTTPSSSFTVVGTAATNIQKNLATFFFGGNQRIAIGQQSTTDLNPGSGLVEVTSGDGRTLQLTHYQYGSTIRQTGTLSNIMELWLGDAGKSQPNFSVRSNGANRGALIQARDANDYDGIGMDFATALRPRLCVLGHATMANSVLAIENNNSNGSIALSTKVGGVTSTDHLVVTNAGNVGIGTTTPYTTLDLKGTANVDPFRVASSSGATLFTILQNGNVGIGIGAPSAKLYVTGVGGANALYVVPGDTPTSPFSVSRYGGIYGRSLYLGVGASGASTLITTNDTNEDLYLDPDGTGKIILTGNVGIGTTTPGTSLQVANGTATTTITIGSAGSGKGGCFEIRDSDDAGWTYCTVLDGVMTCGTTSCE